MYAAYPPMGSVAAVDSNALCFDTAAQSSGYLANSYQHAQQLPSQQAYPDMQPLAADLPGQQQPSAPNLQPGYAPPGAPYSQPYTAPYPQQQQPQYPDAGQQAYQQQQQQQPYHYQQQQTYPQNIQQGAQYPQLSDSMQNMHLSTATGDAGSGSFSPAYQQQPYQHMQQPYPPPQQQQGAIPSAQGHPYNHSMSLPHTQQQQTQQLSELRHQSLPVYDFHSQQQQHQQQPYQQPYTQTQQPYTQQQQQQQSYPQQQQQQQQQGYTSQQQQQQQQPYPYPQPLAVPAPNLVHSSSNASQQYNQQYSSSHQNSLHSSSFGASSFNSAAAPAGSIDTYLYPGAQQQQQPAMQQQQQQQQPAMQQQLPPYPAVPQALPLMPYTAPPEKVCQGYDVMFYIINAKNLPACDWWNGLADPYVIITAHVGGQEFQYKTAHKRRTKNPEYDNEFFQTGNLPVGTTFFVEVWDKDVVTDDDVIGRTSWSFCPQEMLPKSTAGGGLLSEDNSWGRLLVKLPLKHPSKAHKQAGEIELEVCYRPSTTVAPPRMLGPVRFRQHLSPTAGVFTGHWWSDADMSYMTYKLFLTNISSIFDGVRMPWNKNYDKAVQIFKSPMVLGGVRKQHSALYSTQLGSSRGGMLSTAADFFELFKNGMRTGERRFFTYVLCEDSLRCSETGAAFFNDMFSKHAMHSGGAEEVLFAGEFCIMPCPGAAGGHKLVIDNNSGTYAPDKSKLPLMQQLFVSNFHDMTVEVMDMKDPRLKDYQAQCPSRLLLKQQ